MIQHVAFIMDGNRRWARTRNLPLAAGHTKGYQAIEPIIAYAHKKGISHVTFWAFSTENWNRDKKEVTLLLQIFRRLFHGGIIKRLHKMQVRISILGDINAFPQDIAEKLREMMEVTKQNTGITVNIGLNYGGRAEIVRAVKRHAEFISASPEILKQVQDDTYTITEEEFSSYLYTKNQPDPDLIIRTSGEQRLSGFLPWQAVYSELYFPKVYWPDFTEKEFEKALKTFERRQRRYGK